MVLDTHLNHVAFQKKKQEKPVEEKVEPVEEKEVVKIVEKPKKLRSFKKTYK